MDESQLQPFIFPALISLFLLWFITRWLYKPASDKNLPPSPRKLPIIGHLHHLGSLPHQSLYSLAKKHGPIMLLHFGSVPTLVVSSADTACEILKTHDLSFADRPQYKVFKKLLYNCKNLAVTQYGEYWRKVKSIFVFQLLSNKKVQSSHSIREEETALFMKRIQQSPGPVNLTEMLTEFTNDVVCRSALGTKYSDSENGKKFLTLTTEFMDLLATISIGDFVPWLSWITRLNGYDRRVDRVFRGLDDFLEGVIREHVESPKGNVMTDGETFLDIFLQYQKENTCGDSIDRDGIKALILDVFAAGTDTTSTALEWMMSELLQHPAAMEKLQNEVRAIANDKNEITNHDLEKMHYLKAVIKETLRYHPPIPLLMPRVAREDVNVKGYDVKAGTIVMVNAFAIGRDPAYWNEPEKFMPERFLNSSIDFKGLNFEFIPFGAGRRSCPGVSFAVTMMELVLANLVQRFDWEMADGAQGEDMDMTESLGITVRRAHPLLAVANERE